eukprot:1157605-Pelagomonas_calceolata.AAC.10
MCTCFVSGKLKANICFVQEEKVGQAKRVQLERNGCTHSTLRICCICCVYEQVKALKVVAIHVLHKFPSMFACCVQKQMQVVQYVEVQLPMVLGQLMDRAQPQIEMQGVCCVCACACVAHPRKSCKM